MIMFKFLFQIYTSNIFRLTRKSGIKSAAEIAKIEKLFKNFKPSSDLISSCENFFKINIALLNNETSRKVLEKKKCSQKKVQFSRKPEEWTNLLLFVEEGQNLFYLRYKIDEIIPFLSESDCVLKMPLANIFLNFGSVFPDKITEEAIENLETKLQEKFKMIN